MKIVKKGEWVRIHKIILKASERTARLPEDTQKCNLQMWTKGFLMNDAQIGDEVVIETITGRKVEGTLLEHNPYYNHSYGKFVPEIIRIDKDIQKYIEKGGK